MGVEEYNATHNEIGLAKGPIRPDPTLLILPEPKPTRPADPVRRRRFANPTMKVDTVRDFGMLHHPLHLVANETKALRIAALALVSQRGDSALNR